MSNDESREQPSILQSIQPGLPSPPPQTPVSGSPGLPSCDSQESGLRLTGIMAIMAVIYTMLAIIFTLETNYSSGLTKAIAALEALFLMAMGIFLLLLIRLLTGKGLQSNLGMISLGIAIITSILLIMANAFNILHVFHASTPKLFVRGFDGLATLALGVLLLFLTLLILRRGSVSSSRILVLSCADLVLVLFALAGILMLVDSITFSIGIGKAIGILESLGYIAFGILFTLLARYIEKQNLSLRFQTLAFISSMVTAGFIFAAKGFFVIWILNDYSGNSRPYLILYGLSLIAMSIMFAFFSLIIRDYIKRTGEMRSSRSISGYPSAVPKP